MQSPKHACAAPTSNRLPRRRWLGAVGALGASIWGLAGSGCALSPDVDHSGADAPSAGPLAQTPRVAWVFSSGGPRGFVHVGVLKALDEIGVQPDLIVGASAGAFVGVMRASGMTGRQIEALALDLQPWKLARLAIGAEERLAGTALADFIRSTLREPLLERQPIPVACVAQRMNDGAVIGFDRGDAGLAVQAAAAMEGRFTPVRIRGQRHFDADQSMPLPVRVAKGLGALRVLAVDASAHEDRAPAGAERYRVGDLHKRELTRPDAELADVLLHPDFGYWVSLSDEFRRRAIDAGYQATLAIAPRILALHKA
ncbi:MAG: patatin-like phospholipase family protein [Leptothrix sp. (in: b-proteobacteria)]